MKLLSHAQFLLPIVPSLSINQNFDWLYSQALNFNRFNMIIMLICKMTVSGHLGLSIVYFSFGEINMQHILYESLRPCVLLCKQEENIFWELQLWKTKSHFWPRLQMGLFKVWEVQQGKCSDVIITACHYKHETKKQQLIISSLWALNVPLCSTSLCHQLTSQKNMRLIICYRKTKAFPPLIAELNIPQVHRPVLCNAESSLRSHIKTTWMSKT